MPAYHTYFDRYGVVEDIYKIVNNMPIEKLRYELARCAVWYHDVSLPDPGETESNVIILFNFDLVVQFIGCSFIQHKYTDELLRVAIGREAQDNSDRA